ncbi:hypothetical protein [Thalassotalea crassostreae]|uniref:hypothetical protein n=1 Tax=Thalassotalea crassostreae TaxID=1763536 RepID=UPI001D05128E|nr:hypothetical protein [Thalassotalea crassostreae]
MTFLTLRCVLALSQKWGEWIFMKCKKCKSEITAPKVRIANINGTPITASTCPVCGENLAASKKNWIALIILFVAVGVASKYFA